MGPPPMNEDRWWHITFIRARSLCWYGIKQFSVPEVVVPGEHIPYMGL
jgi:hypothetical protein